jgi:hypothetical protein
MKSINKLLSGCLVISMAILIFRCEGMDRYYRPDLPEQICAVGMIDIDDTTIYNPCDSYTMFISRGISIEKSFQSEYPDEINDSLREFSFSISDSREDMFVYQSEITTGNLELVLPESLKFASGTKYFFHASEKETPDISAECTVPELPPELSLLSLKTGFAVLDPADEGCCSRNEPDFTSRYAEIEFSFPNNDPESYYAIVLIGSMSDSPVEWSQGWGSWPINFSVMESNTNGFLYPMQGRNICEESWIYKPGVHCGNDYNPGILDAYYIDGSLVFGENCTLKISTQWDWIKFPPHFIKCFRIRIMSIPKEAYLFYKSLYTSKEQSDDPFSEMVNINGNVTGGIGVIAICRSRELIVYTGQTGDKYDPYF